MIPAPSALNLLLPTTASPSANVNAPPRHIYGVDIDSQAVETTKLSFLLKVLEGETQQSLQLLLRSFAERALPDLGDNIKCGNSLIGPDFYNQPEMNFLSEDERYRINVFDWKTEFPQILKEGGFDAVIGNPPLEKERLAASWPHNLLSVYAKQSPDLEPALGGKLNLFRFFIIKAFLLLRPERRFGMIVPLAVLADISCAATRRFLIQGTRVLLADCFPQKDNASRRVFKRAKLSTVVLTAKTEEGIGAAQQDELGLLVKVYPWNHFTDRPRTAFVKFRDLCLLDAKNLPVPLVDEHQWSLCKKLHRLAQVRRFGEIADFDITRGEINQTIYRDCISEKKGGARLLKGVEVGPYELRSELKQGVREWFDETRFLLRNHPKPIIAQQRIATQRITGVDERLRIVATIVSPPVYLADSTNSITIVSNSDYSLEYLLGLLNSTLFQWRFKLTSTNNNVGTNELESLPFRLIDFQNKNDRNLYEKVVTPVRRLLNLKGSGSPRTPQEKTSLERQITATDTQIDRLVYELYDLTSEEIAIVEGIADAKPKPDFS